ncbi:MAG: HAD family hydrolase [Nitrosomonadales bacterium]|nr:HAD family hydrolase [Nitrosomonadales bacterium]
MKKALFLDRDGIINLDQGYVYQPEKFEFVEGIFDVCRYADEQGYLLVVVTNQAGIGRGYYTEQDFQNLTQWMLGQFAKQDITITAVYHCPYHPQAGIGDFRKESFDRKPNPGMLLRAQSDLALDLKESMLVGDKESDIEAAINAGVGCSVLIAPQDAMAATKGNHAFSSLLNFMDWFRSIRQDHEPLQKFAI